MKTLFQQHPRFLGGLLALAAAGVFATAVLVERVEAASRSRRELQRNRHARQALMLSAPSEEMLRQTSARLVDASRELKAAQAVFRERDARANLRQPVPETSAAAFFDLMEFAGRMREGARAAGVRLSANERFGFGEHANTGPEPESIAAVFRQRIIVEHLLEALWRARPDELIAVRRERPRMDPAIRAETNEAAQARDGVGSFFVLDPAVSARRAGVIEAAAFRLEFVGDTAVLRSLLNSIAGDEWPLSVRLVEASRRDQGEEPRSGATDAAVGVLIRPVPMKFVVTIEFVEMLLPTGAEDFAA